MALRTRLTERLGIEHPVLLAGMGGVSYHRLTAAVSAAGGFGCLGASVMTNEQMVEEIKAVRAATDQPFGVDLSRRCRATSSARSSCSSKAGRRCSWPASGFRRRPSTSATATACSIGVTLGADGEAMFRSSVQATFEFFEADRDMMKLLFVDSLVLGDRFDRHLAGSLEGFIADIEVTTRAAQAAGWVIEAPPRMIAFSVAALISQLAVRRLRTDDGMPATIVADFVVTLLLDGLRPRTKGDPS